MAYICEKDNCNICSHYRYDEDKDRMACWANYDMEIITIHIDNGDVFINGEHTAQLCFDADSVGSALATYLREKGTHG